MILGNCPVGATGSVLVQMSVSLARAFLEHVIRIAIRPTFSSLACDIHFTARYQRRHSGARYECLTSDQPPALSGPGTLSPGWNHSAGQTAGGTKRRTQCFPN